MTKIWLYFYKFARGFDALIFTSTVGQFWSYYIAMDKETLFKVLFKCDINSDQKFNDFSQLTPAGRRVIILVINLALGAKPKDTLKWIKDKNIISDSQYDERLVYDVIRHWKMTSGEVFLKHHKVHEGIQPLKCNISDSSFVFEM